MKPEELPELLPCSGGGEWPVQYFISAGGDDYYVWYKRGELSVTLEGAGERELLCQEIGDAMDSDWSDEETTVYLSLISEAIRAGELETLVVPSVREAPSHPLFVKGQHPSHRVGLTCGKTQSPIPPGSRMNRHERRKRRTAGLHDHDDHCYVWVPANEVNGWIATHPREHAALRAELDRQSGA